MTTTITRNADGWQISHATLSFPKLYVPEPGMKNPPPDARKSYGCDLILDPDTNIDEFWADLQRAAFEYHGQNFNNMNLNWPIRQSGSKNWDDPQFQGRWIVHCSRAERFGMPKVIDGGENPIIDPGIMYPGVQVGVFGKVFGYGQGTQGMGFGLETIMYQGEGTRLDNRMAVKDQMKGMTGAVPPIPAGAPSASPPGQPVANTQAPPGGIAPPGQPQQQVPQPGVQPGAPTQATPGTNYATPPGVTPPQT